MISDADYEMARARLVWVVETLKKTDLAGLQKRIRISQKEKKIFEPAPEPMRDYAVLNECVEAAVAFQTAIDLARRKWRPVTSERRIAERWKRDMLPKED